LGNANSTEEMSANTQGSGHNAVDPQGGPNVFKDIIASRVFLLATALTALAYLAFFAYLAVVTATPAMAETSYFILFYSLVAVSSTLMGFTAYSFRFRLSLSNTKSNAAFGSSSAATSISGSVISCSCHASLLLPLLASVGLSTISGIGLLTAFVEYQFWILSFFIVFNVYLAYRVLNRIQAQHKQTGQTGLK